MRANDIARFLRDEPNNAATTDRVAQQFGVRKPTAFAWLRTLESEGKVENIGGDTWRVHVRDHRGPRHF